MKLVSQIHRLFVCVAIGIAGSLCIAVIAADNDELTERPISDADREHWAFVPIQRPELPTVQGRAWLRTGVDAFILASLEKKELAPAPEVDRTTLLRRLTFDLTGLPPTTEETAAFDSDDSPDAYERVVDRLLAAPAHGERWAQHWLDLARFAETDGFEHDKVRPEAWKYRDWVVAALNADLPYDKFVRLQLCGDLARGSAAGEQALAADIQESEQAGALLVQSALVDFGPAVPTSFCVAGPDMPDVNDQAERRHNLLNELTSTVGSVLLGLQMGCAQCHDHKYDPISQADFYRLRAVFEPAVPILRREQPCNVLALQTKVPPARLWLRGDHRRPGAELRPGFPRIADSAEGNAGVTAVEAEEQDLSRADFAAWLFRESNPLPARVMANRLWQHHFGRGIFDTPSDVGVINYGPTHPELLDWLAAELRDGQWSLKELHRTILGSATYRQASRKTDEDSAWDQRLTADPENALYGRYPRRRLDGETLRDAMLASAGLLSRETGGSGVMPPLPQELTSTLLKGQWSASEREADHYKRSIYLFARRNLRYPIFEAFDRPDANASCAVRSRSTTAPQSLVLLNSDFSLLAAKYLAARVLAESSDSAERVRLIYIHALSRPPTDEELWLLQSFMNEQRTALVGENRAKDSLALPIGSRPENGDLAAEAALVDVCLAIFNANEFLYVD